DRLAVVDDERTASDGLLDPVGDRAHDLARRRDLRAVRAERGESGDGAVGGRGPLLAGADREADGLVVRVVEEVAVEGDLAVVLLRELRDRALPVPRARGLDLVRRDAEIDLRREVLRRRARRPGDELDTRERRRRERF